MNVAGHSVETWERAFPRRFAGARAARAKALPPRVVVPESRARDTGVLERRNPLPVGRYWVDVFQKDADAFSVWLATNREKLKVESTEHFASDPARDWVLFEVLAPVMWNGPGLPDVATAAVKSSADTVQRPPPEPDAIDQIKGAGPSMALPWILGGAAVVAVLLVLSR